MRSRKVVASLLLFPTLVLVGAARADPAALNQAENVVTALDVHTDRQATQLVMQGKQTPVFTVFKLKNPDRLVVDLIHTDLKGVETPRDIDDLRVGRIATTQFKQAGSIVSRFIIGLKPGVQFTAKTEGNALLVIVTGKGEATPPQPAEEANPPKPAPSPAEASAQTKPTLPDTPIAPPQKDYRVVESRGDSQAAKKMTIRGIVTGKDDRITILANRRIEAYQVLEVFTPFRIVMDVYGASMRAKNHEKKLSGRHAERIRVARHADKVRLVLDCAEGKRQPYSIKRLRRGIQIVFQEAVPGAYSPVVAQTGGEAPNPKPVVAPPPVASATLRDLNFRQEPAEARVVLELEGEVTPKLIHADDRSTVLEIPNCKMPLILERTLDTSEFGSAVKSLSAYRAQGEEKVKLVAVTTGRVASRIERREGKLHWVFEAAVKKAEGSAASQPDQRESTSYTYAPDQVAGYSVRQPEFQAGGGGGGAKRKGYHGKRVSLDFKDADIHNILRLISEVAKLNIITSDDVKGKITITMRNVPWDQALDIILQTKKLGKVQQGNIIRVAPLAELTREREMAKKAAEASKQLETLQVRLIPVNYAAADGIMKQVQDVLSDRGSVNVDKRTNVLIVKDVRENLVKAEGLVRSLDTETPQVLIEARIVEANTQFLREVGVQWGGDLSFSAVTGNPTGLPFPNSIVGSGGADDARTNSDLSGTANPGHFAVNLPAAVGAGSGGALGFIFGSAGGAAHLNLRLSALENKGAVKIVSAPKITTLDNHRAKIGQGVSVPISVVSAAGVNTVFVEAKMELEVTPHITQEGSILMAIRVRKNEPDFSRTGARGDPTILKKEAETQVLVRDGDTTVIGGIYTKKTSDTLTGVPLLSDIPILGWFFRNSKKSDERTELLIFITPRIVNRLRATVTQG